MAHLETFTVRIVDGPSSLFTFLSGFDCVLAASCPSEDSALPEVRAALANFVAQSVVASYGVDLGRDACAPAGCCDRDGDRGIFGADSFEDDRIVPRKDLLARVRAGAL